MSGFLSGTYKIGSGLLNGSFRIGADLAVVVTLILIMLALLPELKVRKKEASLMLAIAVSQILELISRMIADYSLSGQGGTKVSLICLMFAYFFAVLSVLFISLYMIEELEKQAYINKNLIYILTFACGVLAIVWFEGNILPDNWFISYDANNNLQITVAYMVMMLFLSFIMLYDLALVISFGKQLGGGRLWSWITIASLPLISGVAAAVDANFPAGALAALSSVIIYINIHIAESREHMLAEKNLMESKAKLLVSQIQPHFIYNSLNSIYYLIGKDPEQAQDAVSTFSDYLRQNINSLKDDKPVPFSEELYHIDAYLKLEQLRFGDGLNIIKDIQATDFLIPPLTVQPLVENAIKHGISQLEEGGTVWICSGETEDAYIVRIEDNGVGFKAGAFKDETGTHIGLFNVNSRLKTMCRGTLSVRSEVGKGTKCMIKLPKAAQPKVKED